MSTHSDLLLKLVWSLLLTSLDRCVAFAAVVSNNFTFLVLDWLSPSTTLADILTVETRHG